ncbi:YhgE/Pip domain-containing protein [Mycetocola reblochoni]|uniref:YhgE/Pip domain-containing protein n=1 Tax=Mycetocola reblochoni TaxID=331618 RepID=UPI001C7CC7D3|nr:YhgE/Pip domain-containing protein [Mycetocola reblochoni]
MTAAVVNNDEPVELDGQLVPLGRQLTAGLLAGQPAGSDPDDADDDDNYTWVISDADGAAEGLADGSYAAVITIPKGFSAAATSVSDPDDARSATIDIATSDNSKLVDDAISRTISETAAATMGTELTGSYLDNIYLGFNTIGDSIGEAADGAAELADGAAQLDEGAGELAEQGEQLAEGARTSASGAAELDSGATQLSSGAGELASGSRELASGASGLADGAGSLSDGLGQLRSQTSQLPSQVSQLNDGAQQLKAGVAGIGPAIEKAAAAAAAQSAAAIKNVFATLSAGEAAPVNTAIGQCVAAGGTLEACSAVAGATGTYVGDELTKATSGAGDMDLSQLDELVAGVNGLADGTQQLADGMPALSDGIAQSADGASQLATGARTLSDGAGTLASGAGELSGGASQLADGTGQLSDGLSTLSDGVSAYVDGAGELAEGTGQLSDGTAELADGLTQAVDELPYYSSDDRSTLAEAVSTPVEVDDAGSSTSLFGSDGAPFFAVLALWAGALASFVVLRPSPRAALSSTRSALSLAARSAALPALIGAIQGVLVAGVLQPLMELSVGDWFLFALLAVIAGAAFALVMQALMAVFRGGGWFLSLIVLIVVLATGVISTSPELLQSVAGLLPTAPAEEAFRLVLVDGNPFLPAVGALVWGGLSLVVTTVVIARSRVVSARRISAPATA